MKRFLLVTDSDMDCKDCRRAMLDYQHEHKLTQTYTHVTELDKE